jgi:sec-independent protein translocase protein TatA
VNLGGPEIFIALLVIALLFGGAKLPKLARSLGSAKGEFEKGVREGEKLATEPKKDETPAVEAKTVEVPKDPATDS